MRNSSPSRYPWPTFSNTDTDIIYNKTKELMNPLLRTLTLSLFWQNLIWIYEDCCLLLAKTAAYYKSYFHKTKELMNPLLRTLTLSLFWQNLIWIYEDCCLLLAKTAAYYKSYFHKTKELMNPLLRTLTLSLFWQNFLNPRRL